MLFAGIFMATHQLFIQNWSSQTHCKCKTSPGEKQPQILFLISHCRKFVQPNLWRGKMFCLK